MGCHCGNEQLDERIMIRRTAYDPIRRIVSYSVTSPSKHANDIEMRYINATTGKEYRPSYSGQLMIGQKFSLTNDLSFQYEPEEIKLKLEIWHRDKLIKRVIDLIPSNLDNLQQPSHRTTTKIHTDRWPNLAPRTSSFSKSQVDAFKIAVKKGDTATAKFLLDKVTRFDVQDALMDAIEKRNLAMVKLLANNAYSLHVNDQFIRAIQNRDHAIVKILVDNVDSYVINNTLKVATAKGYTGIVKLLIDKAGAFAIEDAFSTFTVRGDIAMIKLLIDKVRPSDIAVAFKYAAVQGHQELVEYLLSKVELSDKKYAFSKVAEKGDLVMAKLLVKATPTSGYIDYALSQATFYGRQAMATYLLDQATQQGKNNAFTEAIHQGNIAMVTLLLPHIQDVTSGLGIAVRNKHSSIIAQLIDKATQSAQDEALISATQNNSDAPTLALLASKATPYCIALALAEALRNNRQNNADVLCQHLTNLGQVLYHAAFIAQEDVKTVLLSKSSQQDIHFALNQAAKNGHLSIIESFIDKVTQPAIDNAISTAAKHGYEQIVMYLVDKATKQGKNEALKEGAIKGNQSMVAFLLSHGAKKVDLACSAAAANGHQHLVAYLIDQVTQPGRDMALRNAVEKGHFEIVCYLIDQKAQNDDIRHTLWYAASNGHLPIVTYFSKLATPLDIQEAFIAAAMNGHFNIIMQLIGKIKQPHLGMALSGAASKGHKNLVRWFLENHNNQLIEKKQLLTEKDKLTNQTIEETFKDKLLTEQDMQEALNAAAINRHEDIIPLLHTHNLDLIEEH
eukprot:gene30-43_t